jgi:hypothetical protein
MAFPCGLQRQWADGYLKARRCVAGAKFRHFVTRARNPVFGADPSHLRIARSSVILHAACFYPLTRLERNKVGTTVAGR